MMSQYPVAVLTKSNDVSATDRTNWVTDDVQRAFLDYVRAGHGLLVVHSGTAGYGEATVLRALMGGVFARHPPQCPVTVEPKAGHPLTVGCEPFTVKDEHYFMEMAADARADFFLTTTSEHGTQPGGWTRAEGKGRVCVLTPGHNVEVWLQPSFQALLRNALRWCGRALDE
jgi:type 1 glutamine amidotransferase